LTAWPKSPAASCRRWGPVFSVRLRCPDPRLHIPRTTEEIQSVAPWFFEMRDLIAQRPNLVPTGLGHSASSFDEDVLGTGTAQDDDVDDAGHAPDFADDDDELFPTPEQLALAITDVNKRAAPPPDVPDNDEAAKPQLDQGNPLLPPLPLLALLPRRRRRANLPSLSRLRRRRRRHVTKSLSWRLSTPSTA